MIDINNISQNSWANTKISILGAGKSGIAAGTLGTHIGAEIFISEGSNSPEIIEKISNFNHEVGGHSNAVLDADILIKSPGIPNDVPIIKDCESQNIPIVSEIEFASWFTSSPILALTGSNGKTTTVNLLHEMCISDGRTSLLGGNVGMPFSENVLWELTSNINNSVHVLELSSFQLEHINTFSPTIAGILNISADHLDRYADINAYATEKLKLAAQIDKSGWLVFNADDPILAESLMNTTRSVAFSLKQNEKCHFKLNATKVFSGEAGNPDILFNFEDTKLKGFHNLQNILAAATMAHSFGISRQAIHNSIINFTPIPHRLEWVGNINNVDYFNDSKATNIAAAIAAIESFDDNLILILGGKDKGSTDFNQLIPSMENRVKSIMAYGEAGIEIKNQLNEYLSVTYCEKFEDALMSANVQSKTGDTILLSPACASFDQFSNYEERGNKFVEFFTKLELAN
ncbi:MAG: UDP-N-acetylmuramoyl-L-alanine--D-glutamate ligase [Candidatus Marinimicrobia bacterium]|nr:UDP-N-acetylmuramoyl-L-alanine--D-glutamate ligase [Candidatus Neomarinimicrobiota bacterium]